MRWSVFCIAFLLAGCAEAPETQNQDEPVAEAPPIANETVVIIPIEEVDPLRNLTEFHWATAAALGDAAIEITLDLGSDNDCEVFQAVTGTSERGGTRSVATFDDDSGTGWGAGGGGNLVNVQAGPVSTDDLLGAGGGYGSASGTGGSFSGIGTFTRVAMGIEPADWTDFNSGYSASFSATCSKPFDVLGARLGTEAFVGDTDTIDGTSASAMLVGSVGTGREAIDITRGDGFVRFGSFGDHVGEVRLQSPDTTQSFILPLEENGVLSGGPGTYSVEVDRAGVRFEAYWHTAYGLSDHIDLAAGQLDGPAYESPF